MSKFMGMPTGMSVEQVIIEKVLHSMQVQLEICLVKHAGQYEAALFLDGKYKYGPPMPRPLETPSVQSTHWMGVRPKVGLTEEEAEKIENEVLSTNALSRIQMKDDWGMSAD